MQSICISPRRISEKEKGETYENKLLKEKQQAQQKAKREQLLKLKIKIRKLDFYCFIFGCLAMVISPIEVKILFSLFIA